MERKKWGHRISVKTHEKIRRLQLAWNKRRPPNTTPLSQGYVVDTIIGEYKEEDGEDEKNRKPKG
jgi:hypothetical protein